MQLTDKIIAEILKLQASYLPDIPGGGRGLHLDTDHALLWSTRKVYRLVQGSWLEVPADSLPMNVYLSAFLEAIKLRRKMTEKRISRMSQTLDDLDSIAQTIQAGNLKELERLLGAE